MSKTRGYNIQGDDESGYIETGENQLLLPGEQKYKSSSRDAGDDSPPCCLIKSWTNQQFFTVFLLGLAFSFTRTVVFVQLRITPLFSQELTDDGESDGKVSRLNTIPLACMFYGGCIAVCSINVQLIE